MAPLMPPTWFRKTRSMLRRPLTPEQRIRLRGTVLSTARKRRDVKVSMPKFNLPKMDEDGDGSDH